MFSNKQDPLTSPRDKNNQTRVENKQRSAQRTRYQANVKTKQIYRLGFSTSNAQTDTIVKIGVKKHRLPQSKPYLPEKRNSIH